MKKVINEKLYNTETAEIIFAWENAYFPSDFHYCTETLYRTKKGAWFIHGTGGPLSKYRIQVGTGSFSGSETIETLTENEAYEWLENYANICVKETITYFAHLLVPSADRITLA
ncbi:MAG: hypothetical protein JSV31_19145 [Desulfobacterales bacterium]|nr:MAG: hypothetical protein JSV31_19145 [Desulfobacterales bacterium]